MKQAVSVFALLIGSFGLFYSNTHSVCRGSIGFRGRSFFGSRIFCIFIYDVLSLAPSKYRSTLFDVLFIRKGYDYLQLKV